MRAIIAKGLLPFLLSSFLALGCARHEPPRLLRYAFSTERVQRYRTTLGMTSSSGAETRIMLEETHRVEGFSSDWNARMEIRFDTVDVHLSNPQNLAAGFLANRLKGKTLRVLVSPRGEVKMIGETGDPEMSGANLDPSFSQVFPSLPEGQVRRGDSWNMVRTATIPSPTMDIRNRVFTDYTLAGIERTDGKTTARVRVKARAELEGKPKEANLTGRLQGKMAGEGFFLFSLEEGRLLSLEMKNKTEVTSKNDDGKEVKSQTEQVVTVEALKDKSNGQDR